MLLLLIDFFVVILLVNRCRHVVEIASEVILLLRREVSEVSGFRDVASVVRVKLKMGRKRERMSERERVSVCVCWCKCT